MALSAKEMKRSIASDLKKNLAREEAANLLGMGPQTLSNLLSQPRYFTHKMALRFHEKFGYSVAYLMCGEGNMKDTTVLTPDEKKAYDSSEKALAAIEEQEKEHGRNEPGSPEEDMAKEDEYYRGLDLCAIMNGEWDSVKDETLAYTLFRAADIQINDLRAELDYYMRECQKKIEENKKLFIENTALRRSLKESK